MTRKWSPASTGGRAEQRSHARPPSSRGSPVGSLVQRVGEANRSIPLRAKRRATSSCWEDNRFTTKVSATRRRGHVDDTQTLVLDSVQARRVAALITWQHAVGGQAHCLARLVLRAAPEPPVAVLSELADNPDRLGISGDMAGVAVAFLAAMRPYATLDPASLVWITHHGPFSFPDDDGGPQTFTRVDLDYRDGAFRDDLRAARKADIVVSATGQPTCSPASTSASTSAPTSASLWTPGSCRAPTGRWPATSTPAPSGSRSGSPRCPVGSARSRWPC